MTRTVTNISTDNAGIYDVKVSAPAGTTVTVSPTHLVVPPGQSKSFRSRSPGRPQRSGAWTFGSLTWIEAKGKSPAQPLVRSNIAVRPVAAAVPSEISSRVPAARRRVDHAWLHRHAHDCAARSGRRQRTTSHLTGTNTNFNPAAPAAGPAVAKVTVDVPAGTRLSRFATFDADYAAGADIDLFVYAAGTNTFAGQSAGGTAEESVTGLPAGDYDIYVVLFAQPGGGSGSLTCTSTRSSSRPPPPA